MEYTMKLLTKRTDRVFALLTVLCNVPNTMAATLPRVNFKEITTPPSLDIETTTSELYDLQCKGDKCRKVSYTNIKNTCKGLLYTSDEIRDMENEFNEKRNGYLTSIGLVKKNNMAEPETISDDGGSCCSTSIQHIANTTLKNIHGDDKIVIHLLDADPPRFQYIPHAQCVKKGNCDGTCIIEPKTMFLLVVDEVQGHTFDAFEIPGYCSCKQIYQSN